MQDSGGCKLFAWFDDEICIRGKEVINDQRETLKNLKAELGNVLRKEEEYVMEIGMLKTWVIEMEFVC